MGTRRRFFVTLAIVLAVVLIAGVLAVTRPWQPRPTRIVVLSDSLSEGMGEVTALEKTWPHLLGSRLREYRREGESGGTWLPASLGGDMFEFEAGRPQRGAWPARDGVGVPGAVEGGSVSWDVGRFDTAVVHVYSERAGASFTATSGDRRVEFSSPGAGLHSFEVGDLGTTLTVTGNGAIVGVLGRTGQGSIEVYNLSWSGSSTSDWLWWLDQPGLRSLLTTIDPDVVVLSLGGNDFWNDGDRDRFGAHLRAIHDRVGQAAPRASWILGTQPVADETSETSWLDFQQVTLDYAAELGVPVIDLAHRMPVVKVAPQLYARDRIHLTDAGQAFVADLAESAFYEARP
ncbi:MAG: SGNH/GDSL hydrolase family protein [Propioniciclava sp.]|uniref:SGNH/GDSL hydrolase family protein n=1 Tax=Propioniciclava sp. TaxID=2038686 RepID=UPI0039E22717